jgi:hypothetical protein
MQLFVLGARLLTCQNYKKNTACRMGREDQQGISHNCTASMSPWQYYCMLLQHIQLCVNIYIFLDVSQPTKRQSTRLGVVITFLTHVCSLFQWTTTLLSGRQLSGLQQRLLVRPDLLCGCQPSLNNGQVRGLCPYVTHHTDAESSEGNPRFVRCCTFTAAVVLREDTPSNPLAGSLAHASTRCHTQSAAFADPIVCASAR